MSSLLLIIFLVYSTLSEINGIEPRFSIENARHRIKPVYEMPAEIRQYTPGGNGTGILSEWYKDEVQLELMSRLLTEGVKFLLTNPQNQELDLSVTRIAVEDFISRVNKRFETVSKPIQRYPWGHNWFGFSVDLTTLLGYYLLLPGGKPQLCNDAEELIKLIIINPTLSMGQPLLGSNMVFIAGAWILVKLLDGQVEQAANTSEYKNVLEYLNLKISTLRDEEGLHRDHTFIFHNNGVLFQYFEMLVVNNSAQLLYAIDSDAHSLTSQWEQVELILFHPTIAYGNIGLLGRVRQLAYEINPKSEYGVKVMPISGYFRYFTKSGQFSMRAQKAHLAFYEADKIVQNLGQYWVQYRCVHREKTNYNIQFPAPGLIAHEGDSNLINIPPPDGYSFTKIFLPKSAKSFVMAYKSVGFLYQEYEIAQFGQYSVREFVEIDPNTESVLITIEITNNEPEKSLVYYSPLYWDEPEQDKYTVTIQPRETKLIGTILSMKDKRNNVRVKDPLPITFPRSIGNLKIKEYESAKCFVLFDGGRPVVCAPDEWDNEEDTMKVKLDDSDQNYTTFTFSSLANQYVQSGSDNEEDTMNVKFDNSDQSYTTFTSSSLANQYVQSGSIRPTMEPYFLVFYQATLIFVIQHIYTSFSITNFQNYSQLLTS